MASPGAEEPRDCHRTGHATFTNKLLGRQPSSPAARRRHPDIAGFVSWIRDKHPDFHPPTRRRH